MQRLINITKITSLTSNSSNKVSPYSVPEADTDKEIDVFISEHLQQFMLVENFITLYFYFIIGGKRYKRRKKS